ncbi:hypothetical protein [Kineosporia sp. NBRC 101677]|uniref:hypothetical protein n=1 Tax=Kineosporia sp. NBRC 101677 TaxID=3032197 RepID=UPI002554DD87|nr:hypothetical protein [Kineosporia sp. NBRC 101677]
MVTARPATTGGDDQELAEIGARAKRRTDRWFFGTMIVCLLVTPLAVAMGIIAAEDSDDGGTPWWVWLLITLAGVLPILVTLPVFWWLRRRGVRWLSPVLAAGVDRERRKAINKAIRSGQAVEPRDQPLAQDLAERTVMQRWTLYLLLPVMVLISANRLLSDERVLVADLFVGVGALGFFCSLPFTWRNVRRAKAWLAQHGTRADAA